MAILASETKLCENKMLVLNLRPKPFGSDALLSKVLRHVLLEGSVRILCGHATLVLDVSSKFK